MRDQQIIAKVRRARLRAKMRRVAELRVARRQAARERAAFNLLQDTLVQEGCDLESVEGQMTLATCWAIRLSEFRRGKEDRLTDGDIFLSDGLEERF